MSRLLQFKEWLTIPESAEYLTKELGELVKESDIYYLALQDTITLSVLLPIFGTNATTEPIPSIAEQKNTHEELAEIYSNYGLSINDFIQNGELSNDKLKHCLSKINNKMFTSFVRNISQTTMKSIRTNQEINGIWDICLLGDSDVFLNKKYYEAINQSYEEPAIERGLVLRSLEKNKYAALYEPLTQKKLFIKEPVTEINFEGLPPSLQQELKKEKEQKDYDFKNKITLEMPTVELADEVVIIIKKENLQTFLKKIKQNQIQSTAYKKRYDSILKLIAILLYSDSKLPLDTPYKTAGLLEKQGQLFDIKLSDDTIKKIIEEAMENYPKS